MVQFSCCKTAQAQNLSRQLYESQRCGFRYEAWMDAKASV